MYPVSSNDLNRDDEKEVRFFTTAFHPLDNFSAHAVRIWERKFMTAEHAYQWKKLSDIHPEAAEEIYEAGSPELVKAIAAGQASMLPGEWHEVKVAMMEEILRAKANQHEDVREVLRKSGTRTIIENSPADTFWGVGPEGDGLNTLGKLWMKIREEIA